MQASHEKLARLAKRGLIAVAIAYAFFAGLRTVADFDTGWQLATGRYVVQHHIIPTTDVLSYTSAGEPFVYSPFAGVLLYLIMGVAGYAGLSWFCALTCVATTAITLRRAGLATAALAVLAVPAIASRTGPRADMFTTLLFAALLSVLWECHREEVQLGARSRLWLLPLLMVLWANLHSGFIAGLGLIAAYVFVEALELPFASRRDAGLNRLRRAWPWLAASFVAPLINPLGFHIYRSALEMAGFLTAAPGQLRTDLFIGELSRVPRAFFGIAQGIDLRNPDSGYWWLAVAAAVVTLLAIWRKRLGVAVLLAGALYESIQRTRYQGIFAITVVIVAGAFLRDEFDADEFPSANGSEDLRSRSRLSPRASAIAAGVLLLVLGTIGCLRIADLTDNRYYVVSGTTSLFGAGESWWFPERAAAFIEREQLPGNIFQEYNLGGFTPWRLGPQYPDFIDGRGVSAAVFQEQQAVLAQPPDSAAWATEADRRGINVLLFSLARVGGLGSVDIAGFCQSTAWRPVYMDELSIVFLRNTPENQRWLPRLAIDCRTQPLNPPATDSRAMLFNFYSNAAGVFYVLGRDGEAAQALDRAEELFPQDPNVHLTRAQLYQAQGRADQAEREYRAALDRKQIDSAWYALGRMYAFQHRYAESADALEHAARLSVTPHNAYKSLGQVELALQQPQKALNAFAEAESSAPYRHGGEEMAKEFYAQLAEGRAEAHRRLGDMRQAVDFQLQAVERTPNVASRWNKLADLYDSTGQAKLADEARQRALALQPPPAP